METLDKKIYYNNLLVIYKGQLTHKQQDILIKYFQYDLSLREIAEENNISHSAVEDAINKATKKLDDLESDLHLAFKKEKMLDLLQKLKQNSTNLKQIDIINELEEELK